MRLASHSPFKASKILNNGKTNCHKLLASLVQDVPAWFSPSQSSRISVERWTDRQERGGGVGRRGGEESGGNSQQSQFRAALHLAPAVHLPPLDRFERSNPGGAFVRLTGSFSLWDGNRISQVEFNQRNNCWQKLKTDNTFGRRQSSVNDLGEQRAEAAAEAEAE